MMSHRTYLNGREVRGMTDETEECRHRVALLKESAESANNARSYLLKGLWACRLAAGLNQHQLTQAMGSSQGTVGQLERGDRRACLRTIVRLCDCLGVAPEDLLSGDSPSEPKTGVDRIRR
jgi:DNA-binding Xre family transcriptional regulator